MMPHELIQQEGEALSGAGVVAPAPTDSVCAERDVTLR